MAAKIKSYQLSTLIGEIKQGEVKMIDFTIVNKALKVAWIPRLQSRSDASWKIIPDAALENLGGTVMHSFHNVTTMSSFCNLTTYRTSIVTYWNIGRIRDLLFFTSPCNEIIWNNHNITIDGKAPFFIILARKKHFTDWRSPWQWR